MEHTKAPWKIREQFDAPLLVTDEENGAEWYALSCYIMNSKDRIIGNVNYQTDIPQGWRTVNNLHEMRANAKLIAAAPELLASLKEVMDIHPDDAMSNEIYARANQAIKNAK